MDDRFMTCGRQHDTPYAVAFMVVGAPMFGSMWKIWRTLKGKAVTIWACK